MKHDKLHTSGSLPRMVLPKALKHLSALANELRGGLDNAQIHIVIDGSGAFKWVIGNNGRHSDPWAEADTLEAALGQLKIKTRAWWARTPRHARECYASAFYTVQKALRRIKQNEKDQATDGA